MKSHNKEKTIVSSFITNILEKNYSSAGDVLETLIEAKLKNRIKKIHDKCECDKKKKSKKVVKEDLSMPSDISDVNVEDEVENPSEDYGDFEQDNNTPQEDDYVISSTGNLGGRTTVTLVGHKTPLGTYTEEEDAEKAIKNHMRVYGERPVWFNDDHGGYTLRKL